MDMGYIIILMELDMKEIGWMICRYEFRINLKHGKGKEIWTDSAVYEGEYRNGKKNGIGLFTWMDGARYYGDFVDN